MGFGSGFHEYRLGQVVSDVCFLDRGVCVEVDMGTESRQVLKKKIQAYLRVPALRALIFLTQGAKERADFVVDRLRGNGRFAIVGARMQELTGALRAGMDAAKMAELRQRREVIIRDASAGK